MQKYMWIRIITWRGYILIKNKYTFNCFFGEIVSVEIYNFQYRNLTIINYFLNLTWWTKMLMLLSLSLPKFLWCVWLFATLWIVAHQAPLSMGFSRQVYWGGLPLPSPGSGFDLKYTLSRCYFNLLSSHWRSKPLPNVLEVN